MPDFFRRFARIPQHPTHAASLAALTMVIGVAFVLIFATGCQSSSRHERWQVTSRDLRRNMSPTLKTLAETPDQHATTKARVGDLNLRMIHHDMDAVLLRNRPSYLTPYPIP